MGERTRAGVLMLCGVLLSGALAGCSGDGSNGSGPADASSGPSGPATPSASVPPVSSSPEDGLTVEERAAFEEATTVVLAYRQTIADLYSGARTDLNDLDKVATGDLLDRELSNVAKGLAKGYRTEPVGAQMLLVSAEPEDVDLAADSGRVVVRACVDATSLTDVNPDGSSVAGPREELVYTVVRTTYLPSPGWAVAEVRGAADPEGRRC